MTPDDYVEVGRMSEASGNTENARENFHKALKMKPHHLGALLGLARLFDRQGQMERATEHYLEAVKYHPKDATAWNDLGQCYARQGQFQESLAALQTAVDLQPDRDLYRNNIATVLVELDRIDEALEHLTYIHGKAIAHYNLGYLLYQRGRQDQSLEQFGLALQTDPSLEPAQTWIAKLSGQELEPAGNPETAVARRATASDGSPIEYGADEPGDTGEAATGPQFSDELLIEELPTSSPDAAADASAYDDGWRQPGQHAAASPGWSSVNPATGPTDGLSRGETNAAAPSAVGAGAGDDDEAASGSSTVRLQRLPPVPANQSPRSRY